MLWQPVRGPHQPVSNSSCRSFSPTLVNVACPLIKNARRQRTINHPVSLSGFSYWSGQDVTVEFHPAPENTGCTFVRVDLDSRTLIPAAVRNRIETPRRTTLASGDCSVEMVEHALSALAGLQIDNCFIHVSGSEMPAWDGSCRDAVQALCEAGILEQSSERTTLVVDEAVRVGDDQSWIEARPPATRMTTIAYELNYGPGPIGHQKVEFAFDPDKFREEIASARTFLLESEAEAMVRAGIGKKATYENLLVFAEDGPLGNSLRFPDECARHKILDIVGDLALTGFDIHADIVAYRSGHRQNTELARQLCGVYDATCTQGNAV